MARVILDMGALDSQLQSELAMFGDVRQFHIAIWREPPDASGSNWNACVVPIGRNSRASGDAWETMVRRMRERFNLPTDHPSP